MVETGCGASNRPERHGITPRTARTTKISWYYPAHSEKCRRAKLGEPDAKPYISARVMPGCGTPNPPLTVKR